MTLAESLLQMTATASEPNASATLTIGNEAEGILKWKAEKNTVGATLMSRRPQPGHSVRPFGGKISDFAANRAKVAAAPEFNADDYPGEIFAHELLWAMIGESDKSLPNSMAQWFKVDPEISRWLQSDPRLARSPDGGNIRCKSQNQHL